MHTEPTRKTPAQTQKPTTKSDIHIRAAFRPFRLAGQIDIKVEVTKNRMMQTGKLQAKEKTRMAHRPLVCNLPSE